MLFGCFWCYKKTDGSLLKTPSCKTDRECYGGVLGRGNPFLLPHPKARKKAQDSEMFTILGLKLNMASLIAASIALGVLVLICIVTIYCLCRRKALYEEDEMEFESMDMFGLEDQPQLMDPTDVLTNDQAFGPLQLNYPGQSKVMQSNMQMMGGLNYPGQNKMMQSNMQMRLGGLNYPGQSKMMQSNTQMRLRGPRMNYSTQAMSGMWARGYGQSQLMSFLPQMSTMHTPLAYPRKPKSKKTRPKKTRKVSFANEVQGGAAEQSNALSENSPTAQEPLRDSEVIEDLTATEKDEEL